jgi:hypothetical protein
MVLSIFLQLVFPGKTYIFKQNFLLTKYVFNNRYLLNVSFLTGIKQLPQFFSNFALSWK